MLFVPGGNQKLSVGINAKIVYRNIGKFANGFGLDLMGAIYRADSGYQFELCWDATTTVNFGVSTKRIVSSSKRRRIQSRPKDKMEITMPKLNLGVSKNFEINRDLELLPEAGLNVDFAKTAAVISTDFASISPYLGGTQFPENDFCESWTQ